MNTVIIYGSCYGTTEVYAKALAHRMGVNAVSYDRTGDLSGYQWIIYLGGLYAGGVKGLAKTVKKIDPAVCGRLRSGEKEAPGRTGRRDKSDGRDIWAEGGFCGSGTAGRGGKRLGQGG